MIAPVRAENMIEPRRIGRFLTLDPSGYLKPDVSVNNIQGEWKTLVEYVSRELARHDPNVSVYVRGSVPRGLAINGVSDIDFIYLSEINGNLVEKTIEDRFRQKTSIASGIEFTRLNMSDFSKIHPPQRRPYFHMLIKTQAVCVAGFNVSDSIAPFRIDRELVSHVFNLRNEYSKLPAWLAQNRAKDCEIKTRQWFSRRVVRSGLEITLDRIKRFTRDLYLCYEQFAECYPETKSEMLDILENCLNGNDDLSSHADLIFFLAEESKRLLTN